MKELYYLNKNDNPKKNNEITKSINIVTSIKIAPRIEKTLKIIDITIKSFLRLACV